MTKLANYEIVGRNLKRIMKEKHITGCQLVKRVGCHDSQITDIVYGHYSPKLSTLFDISVALEIDIRELFKPYDDEPEINEVTKLFYGMTPSMQKAVIEIMKVSQEEK